MIPFLKQLGLSEKEAKVYLVSLELGPEVIQKIAQQTGINRTTTYVVVESLTKKGLMSSTEKKGKRYFAAEPPRELARLLRLEEEEIRRKEEELKGVLSELNNIFKSAGKRLRVRFYEGKEGLISVQNEILNTKGKNFEEIAPLDDAQHIFPPRPNDHRQQWRKKIKSQNIFVRTIYTNKGGPIFPPEEYGGRIKNKFIPYNKFPFHTEISIFGNKVVFMVLKGKLAGIIIEDEFIAETFRTVFNLIWETAEKYQK